MTNGISTGRAAAFTSVAAAVVPSGLFAMS